MCRIRVDLEVQIVAVASLTEDVKPKDSELMKPLLQLKCPLGSMDIRSFPWKDLG